MKTGGGDEKVYGHDELRIQHHDNRQARMCIRGAHTRTGFDFIPETDRGVFTEIDSPYSQFPLALLILFFGSIRRLSLFNFNSRDSCESRLKVAYLTASVLPLWKNSCPFLLACSKSSGAWSLTFW
ncbi:hypothetical protein K1719_040467 [Acacia pycnantha]|nr:hypothetical protein K1719_040467 [Acacia pycnantha]